MEKTDIWNRIICSDNFDEIMQAVYELMENPVFIVDKGHNVLVYTDVPLEDEEWKRIVKDQHITEDIVNDNIRFHAEDMQAFHAPGAILLKNTMFGQDQIKKALKWNSQQLGMMMVLPYFRAFCEEDLQLADLIGNLLAFKMTGSSGLIHQHGLHAKSFFASLLSGYVFPEDQWKLYIRKLFKKPAEKWYLAVIHQVQKQDGYDIEKELKLLNDTENAYAFVYENHLLLVINRETELKDLEIEYPLLCNHLKETGKIICVSNECSELSGIKEYYNQVISVLRIALELKRSDYIYVYHNMVIYDILEKLPLESLDKYVHEDIIKLRKYDLVNKSDLCPTLHVYLNVNRSLARASEIMFLHKNTINKRINRCKEIMNTDLTNHTEVFSYFLSLTILELKNSKNGVCWEHTYER